MFLPVYIYPERHHEICSDLENLAPAQTLSQTLLGCGQDAALVLISSWDQDLL